MGDPVRVGGLLTQTPCGSKATASGLPPTGSVAITWRLRGSSFETEPPELSATHTAPPPAAMAMGFCPTLAVEAFPVTGSILETWSSRRWVTQMAPSPAATW